MFSLPTEKIWLKSYVCEARNLQMKPGHHKALKKEINVCLPPQSIGFRTKTIYQMWTIYNSNNGPYRIMNRYNASIYTFHNTNRRYGILNFNNKISTLFDSYWKID